MWRLLIVHSLILKELEKEKIRFSSKFLSATFLLLSVIDVLRGRQCMPKECSWRCLVQAEVLTLRGVLAWWLRSRAELVLEENPRDSQVWRRSFNATVAAIVSKFAMKTDPRKLEIRELLRSWLGEVMDPSTVLPPALGHIINMWLSQEKYLWILVAVHMSERRREQKPRSR